jgi:hypothetical protein
MRGLYQGMTSKAAENEAAVNLAAWFVSGHDFSHADKANKTGTGFSPCYATHVTDSDWPPKVHL